MAGHRLARLSTAALLIGAVLMGAAPAQAEMQPLLFGADELASKDITLFPQWTSTLARLAAEPAVWPASLGFPDGATAWDRIQAVNDAVNRVGYVEDIDNWGVSDHWSTPAEFFAQGGDCEDYAIAKYVILRRAGLTPDQLRVVVVQDERTDRRHAVLAVYTDRDILILDNQKALPIPAAQIAHYRPYYSINEQGWWLH